ncbi:MAG: cytochrome bc complex cytochrome b subunit [Streptosporangiaceae bacterium]|nr:cytochrome bc complex cytochrome b subunit [Streptosporangiaceae bacterium]
MSDDVHVPGALRGLGNWVDERFGGAGYVRTLMKKVFPDHWSFFLGEIALYSFVILLLTGTFLSLFFVPSMNDVVYHGSYIKLNGLRMSEAYASTLRISFDVRGGLLIRQIHHWAADIFMVAITVHMLRIFFTGAYRKPREVNWLIGIILFSLGLIEGLFGYSLPDDQLSGAGLRIFEGVLQGIPIVGTYLAYFLFGGGFPGNDIVPRMYIIHVLLIPGLILALVTAHLLIMFHQKHTAMPAKDQTDTHELGQPFFPYFIAKTTAWLFFVFAALAILATFAQINPIWQYGPYTPLAISSASQPDWYMGILEGALRMMPAWEINFLGHTLSLSVLIPFALPLGIILGGAAFWPWFEKWATGDNSEHHVLDRPRNAAVRTSIGIAVVVFYGVLWAEGANDVIANKLQIPLYTVTWISRVLVIVGPILAYFATKRICIGLQRKDAELLEHGLETGIIVQRPNGEFEEIHRPVSEEARAVLEAKKVPLALPVGAAAVDENGVSAPQARGLMGKMRVRANQAFLETIPLPAGDGHGHGNGHEGNGHGEVEGGGQEHAAVGASTAPAELDRLPDAQPQRPDPGAAGDESES